MQTAKKILIIDDNEDILYMLKAILELKDFEVKIKLNIADLEKDIMVVQPDVILMDMLLSGADGREVCKSLKEHNLFARIPIIMISAHSHAKEECLKAGANQFLEKPFDIDDIYSAVEKALDV